jgi:nucleotide-binding universal stress UspA family protein
MATSILEHGAPRAATRGAPPDRAGRGPIVVGVDGTASGEAAAQAAIAWAERLDAGVVFVFVRRPPMDALGEPYYGRRVEAATLAARSALAPALEAATAAGVSASSEIVDGRPAQRLVELARLRQARLLITGPRTRRRHRSVPRRVVRSADRPVLVAAA